MNLNSTNIEHEQGRTIENDVDFNIQEDYLSDLISARKKVVSAKSKTSESRKLYENDLSTEEQEINEFIKKASRRYTMPYIDQMIKDAIDKNLWMKGVLISIKCEIESKGYSFENLQDLMGLDSNIKRLEDKNKLPPIENKVGLWEGMYDKFKVFRGGK